MRPISARTRSLKTSRRAARGDEDEGGDEPTLIRAFALDRPRKKAVPGW
jgi:hypothetical protein